MDYLYVCYFRIHICYHNTLNVYVERVYTQYIDYIQLYIHCACVYNVHNVHYGHHSYIHVYIVYKYCTYCILYISLYTVYIMYIVNTMCTLVIT